MQQSQAVQPIPTVNPIATLASMGPMFDSVLKGLQTYGVPPPPGSVVPASAMQNGNSVSKLRQLEKRIANQERDEELEEAVRKYKEQLKRYDDQEKKEEKEKAKQKEKEEENKRDALENPVYIRGKEVMDRIDGVMSEPTAHEAGYKLFGLSPRVVMNSETIKKKGELLKARLTEYSSLGAKDEVFKNPKINQLLVPLLSVNAYADIIDTFVTEVNKDITKRKATMDEYMEEYVEAAIPGEPAPVPKYKPALSKYAEFEQESVLQTKRINHARGEAALQKRRHQEEMKARLEERKRRLEQEEEYKLKKMNKNVEDQLNQKERQYQQLLALQEQAKRQIDYMVKRAENEAVQNAKEEYKRKEAQILGVRSQVEPGSGVKKEGIYKILSNMGERLQTIQDTMLHGKKAARERQTKKIAQSKNSLERDIYKHMERARETSELMKRLSIYNDSERRLRLIESGMDTLRTLERGNANTKIRQSTLQDMGVAPDTVKETNVKKTIKEVQQLLA